MVAQQTQILQMLAQNQMHQQQPHGRQGQPQNATYGDFAATHPPTYAKAEDPLEADSWLRLMESKFEFLTCTETRRCFLLLISYVVPPLLGGQPSWPCSPLDIRSHGLSFVPLFERTIFPQVS